MRSDKGLRLLAPGLWLLLMATALWTRPPLPVDETRYLSVAWEMWERGNFLVPYLNGEPYSHKPPLLFWLIHAGWGAFGVNDWWPRLVAPLFGLACLFLTAALGRRLWPAEARVPAAAPLLLIACGFWTLFTTLTMFDMLLACFALISLIGIVGAWRDGGWKGWALAALGIGLGVLAKGPAILLHVLPVALLGPVWAPSAPPGGWKRWYGATLLAVLGGAALALLWAIPAAIHGGAIYRNAIFWGQTAGRMVDSFAHERPIWWYLATLPGLLLPLLLWPALWRALRAPRGLAADPGLRLCAIWLAAALVVFSLVSGKQLHYLLPEFPAIALILARALSLVPEGEGRRSHLLPALVVGGAGVGLFLYGSSLVGRLAPEYAGLPDAGWGIALALIGLGAALLPIERRPRRLALLASLPVAAVLAVHLAARPVLARAFDLRPLALKIAAWEAEGLPIANYGTYHGQFHFLGRLRRPIDLIGDQDAEEWLRDHPTGKIISYQEEDLPAGVEVDAVQPFRSHLITVWDAATAASDPRLLRRREE